MALSNIRIVLARPTHPGNVGATARAMKNMALNQLFLVAPENYHGTEAADRAVGAVDVLQDAVICETLDEALKDCHLVIGTSARQRRIDWPALEPDTCARRLLEGAQQGPVALLFGQERTGLLNAELDRCHFLVTIPTDPDYSSLNLACAVQILTYEIYQATLSVAPPQATGASESPPVTAADMQGLYRHTKEVLEQIHFLDPANPRKLMRRLARLFNRAGLDRNELNILRGILTAVQQDHGKLDNRNQE
jgi:TrmH family RNA methyltransferase